MSRGSTVSDMLDELRAAVEEENSVQLRDDFQLLPLINRAHTKAYDILSQVYPEPLLGMMDLPISSQNYVLPENLYQDKINKTYWIDGAGRKLQDCSKSGLDYFSDNEGLGQTGRPSNYIILGRSMRFPVAPNGTLRVFYMQELENLVEPIATVDGITGTDTIQISELDVNYDFTSGRTSGYVNIVDGQTGLIKATVQIRTSGSDELVIRTSPDRSKVLNRTVSSDLTTLVDSLGNTVTIESDDYICAIKGTCVLPYYSLVHDFIIQESIAGLKRHLGYAYDVDQQLVSQFRTDMRKAAVSGRDAPLTIRRRNPIWNMRNWNWL